MNRNEEVLLICKQNLFLIGIKRNHYLYLKKFNSKVKNAMIEILQFNQKG
ncbi:hypothetical protein M947_05810 [Sulfurimonas hongkongensis]|uniref:Uncharacterized protein n=1 Tax=Sulfurimonas hongkongensis TaxID=1172190 RepID=T0JES6_9BACT|nr:hypothetical protein M947_05810 [Sulfurimonas hongkongensis]